MEIEKITRIIEALLFAAEKPLSLQHIDRLLPEAKRSQIESTIEQLNTHYKDHSFGIIKVAGGYQLVTQSEYHEWIQRMFAARSKPRLSQAALEALSVIAYKQPVSRIEIEAIRGVNSDGVLGTLLERNLITIKGRAETVGRPLLYGTTEDFLHYFGLNDIYELPRPEEIEALLQKKEEEQYNEEDIDLNPVDQDET